MDKNVSGVDLDELLKAREELNKEIGVETDPNMYSDYNPNRKNEEDSGLKDTSVDASENSDDAFDVSKNDNHIVFENSKSDYIEEKPTFEDGYSETSKSNEEKENVHSSANENLGKYDVFAAFEVKENAHSEAGEKLDFNKLEDSSTRTTTLEKIEEELKNSTQDEDSELESVSSEDSKLDSIEDVSELESMLDKLLDDLDEEFENNKKESKSEGQDYISEILENGSEEIEDKENNDDTEKDDSDMSSSYLTSIDIEPTFKDIEDEKSEIEESEELETPKKEDRLEMFMKGNLGVGEQTRESSEETDEIEEIDVENQINDLAKKIEPEYNDSEDSDINNEELDVKIESENNELDDTDKLSDDEIDSSSETDEQGIDEVSESTENIQVEDEILDEPKKISLSLESYDATKASASSVKKSSFENSLSDGETEIITDYSQLREILQRELKESEMASQEKIEEDDDDGVKYAVIEEFKFLDEIATDEFKNSDRFSYIMGKNEKGEMIYGNFREHNNLGVFGTNETVINSFLNSMVLSLCLKNSTADVNFVMLDSNINSSFEVYNKSSYLYFNRIAKTNKEILDTLIEITKELDIRYEKLAEAGMGNVDQFNDMAKETATTPMTNLILVFNNYTEAAQATYVDKINACLYQILKFGRIVGIYAVVTAMLPIQTSQVNYNLSSRLSFKSDHDSKYTVGVEGTHRLPDESDAIYFNISKNTTDHIKTATVTDTELDLIIKELEE